jgi:hypothetical protein
VNYDFRTIRGPKASSRENFEQLVCQLLEEEINAISIDGTGGDQGIDCFFRRASQGIEVFQAKYFLGPLTASQKHQIEHSLSVALRHHNPHRWVLCIPRDHTPAERRWFEALGPPTAVLEWWGETKLRNLLARQPQIAEQFFVDERLLEELARFRTEVIMLLKALRNDPNYSHASLPQGVWGPISYLNRAEEIAAVLLDDLSFFASSPSPLVSIDVFDIHMFMETDSRFLASAPPIIDYCLDESPVPLVLLPPSCLELNAVIQYYQHAAGGWGLEQAKTPINTELLEAFLSSYEDDPNSAATEAAYGRIAMEYPAEAYFRSIGLLRLKDLINRQKITFLREETGIDFNSSLDRMPQALDALRITPRLGSNRAHAQYVDALNLVFLLHRWEEASDPIRMISSARSFVRAARALFPNRGPVRTAQEYSYVLNFQTASQGNTSSDDLPCFQESIALLRRTVSTYGEQSWHDANGLQLALSAFEKFAPYYRRYLRPVDEMILTSVRLAPRKRSFGMSELYEFLTSEAELVSAFERWWDHVSELLRSFSARIPPHEETKQLLGTLQDRLK